MPRTRLMTAVIERESDWFAAHCPTVNVASQGKTIDEARENFVEALTMFFEDASQDRDRATLARRIRHAA